MDMQLITLHVLKIDVGNLKFSSVRRLKRAGDLDNLIVINIDAWNRKTALGVYWLLFEREGFSMSIKLHYAVALWIFYVICEDCGADLKLSDSTWKVITAGEDVVAQH